jgi:site-specific recombinase XerD
MILLGALQGFRVSEIASVRGEMFDMVENTIRYVSKGGIPREAQMHPMIRAEAWKYPRRGYWFPSRGTNPAGHIRGKSVSDLIARAMDRAGIRSKRLTAHSLRHFFATQLLDAGTDIRVIQHMMGHVSLATTALYTRVSRTKEISAIETLPHLEVPAHAPRRGSRDENTARVDDVNF